MLAAARAVETASLLSAGKAHWTPRTFHFELPSGQHRSDFIRVGDAFRHPRDAEALATWLYPYADVGRALVLDSSTMLPLAMALRSAATLDGWELGPVVVRDDYPHSRLRDVELIDLTVGANGVLGLVSVSSTGTTVEALASTLDRNDWDWWIEVLVDRTTRAATALRPVAHDEPQQGVARPWLHIPEPPRLDDEPERDPGRCNMCDGLRRAPYVRIDPSSFSNTLLPEPSVIAMPDPPSEARRIDLLLEMYDRQHGIGIDCDPAQRTSLRRSPGRWGVRFYPHRLLGDDRFLQSVANQLGTPTVDPMDGRSDIERLRGFDTIVYLVDDRVEAPQGFDDLCLLLERLLGSARREAKRVGIPSKPTKTSDRDLVRALRASSHILLLTIGSVTGGTLQELMVRVAAARAGNPSLPYVVSGFIIHARPPSFREWSALRSSMYRRLVAAWLTYFPSDHPLADEKRLYRQTAGFDRLSPAGRQYVEGRERWVLQSPHSDWDARRATWDETSGAPNPEAVLCCSLPSTASADLPHLLPNSRFGQGMSMAGTLAGVGAVLQRTRLEQEATGGPPGLRFDLSRVPVVYFETPIVAAVLRWIRPSEAFWEYSGRSTEDVILEMWHRASFEVAGSQTTLLAELLVAAASGKVPRHAEAVLRDLAADLRSRVSLEEFAPVEVGLQMIETAWPTVERSDDQGESRPSPS
jgi:hypothetical protein